MFEGPPKNPAETNKPSENKKHEMLNVFEMETENAQYKIYYDNHESVIDPRLLDGCDGLIMEMSEEYNDPEKVKKMFEKISSTRDLHDLFQEAAKSGKPIYFADMYRSEDEIETDFDKTEIKAVVEFLAGAGIGMYALKSLEENKKMSRRDFLKIGLGTAAAAYLSTPFLERAAFVAATKGSDENQNLLDEKSISRKANKALGGLNRAIHPELRTILVETRNDIMAQKAETIAKLFHSETGKKPKMAFTVGGKHSGIEKSLMDSEQGRVARLKKDLGEKLSQYADIAEVSFVSRNKEANEISFDVRILKDAALEK